MTRSKEKKIKPMSKETVKNLNGVAEIWNTLPTPPSDEKFIRDFFKRESEKLTEKEMEDNLHHKRRVKAFIVAYKILCKTHGMYIGCDLDCNPIIEELGTGDIITYNDIIGSLEEE